MAIRLSLQGRIGMPKDTNVDVIRAVWYYNVLVLFVPCSRLQSVRHARSLPDFASTVVA